jgi:hypothetical protein
MERMLRMPKPRRKAEFSTAAPMKRRYRHIPYRTGIATEVGFAGLEFTLVAKNPEKLIAAFTRITGGLIAFDPANTQPVKISHNPERRPCHAPQK